jgi:hypothetical protein
MDAWQRLNNTHMLPKDIRRVQKRSPCEWPVPCDDKTRRNRKRRRQRLIQKPCGATASPEPRYKQVRPIAVHH